MPPDFAISVTSAPTAGLAPEVTPPGLTNSCLLTTREVARLLRVDGSSVRRWRAERPPQGPPFIRLSERVVLYDVDDLQTWLKDRRTTPGARPRAA
ncbi:helix-turn-helix transcriptional regulator [Actinacidiphila yanglinensis]|uniref:helix-turn-helix transcriptional regulator n=1 Tax=Actinacidiphila yanglinensis TaxID=310779 RepID=UPI000D1CF5CC|nr:helix-turn-helix domain-containing protein [Actinacidiphila yanglinensis]